MSEAAAERRFQFLLCRGNYSDVVRRALARRAWWRDMVAAAVPPPRETKSGKVIASQRKLADERHDAYVLEQLHRQEFDLLWKPTRSAGGVHVPGLSPSAAGGTGASAGTDTAGTTASSSSPSHHHPPQHHHVHSIPLPAARNTPSGSSTPQMVNHLPSADACLTTKPGICRSLTAYYADLGLNPFHAVPTTFLINSAFPDDAGWSAFAERFKAIAGRDFAQEDMPAKHCSKNMWIVKPPNSNQGRGIRVFSGLSQVKRFVGGGGRRAKTGFGNEWVVQKYLEAPLLLWGRKFDIRIWVLVTHDFEIYMYREGYLRTSSSLFTTDLRTGGDQSFVHLTNFCMQKHSPSVGKYEDGNTLSFDDFQCYLDEHHAEHGVSVRNHVLPKIKTLVVDALLAGREKGGLMEGGAEPPAKRRSFELFGYDFMIDEDFRPWLIEVNTNPYLGGQNDWHGKLVECMVEDMVCTAVDPLYPCPSGLDPHVEMPEPLRDCKWRVGFEMLWSEKRGHVANAGVSCPADRRQATAAAGSDNAAADADAAGLVWYYAPLPVPAADEAARAPKQRHLSSRDRAVKHAKERVKVAKAEAARDQGQRAQAREDARREMRAARLRLRDESRRALREAFECARSTETVAQQRARQGWSANASLSTSPSSPKRSASGSPSGSQTSPPHNTSPLRSSAPRIRRSRSMSSRSCGTGGNSGTDADRAARRQRVTLPRCGNISTSPVRNSAWARSNRRKSLGATLLPINLNRRHRSSTLTQADGMRMRALQQQQRVAAAAAAAARAREAARAAQQAASATTHKNPGRSSSVPVLLPSLTTSKGGKGKEKKAPKRARDSASQARRAQQPRHIKEARREQQRQQAHPAASADATFTLPSSSSSPPPPSLPPRRQETEERETGEREKEEQAAEEPPTSPATSAPSSPASSSLPSQLSPGALAKRRAEVLARVQFECERNRRDYAAKRDEARQLKQKQQAWVQENLKIKHDEIARAAALAAKKKRRAEEAERECAEKQASEREARRQELRRQWLARQREKKRKEQKRAARALRQQQRLDELSRKRESDNQRMYSAWMREKRERRERERQIEIERRDAEFAAQQRWEERARAATAEERVKAAEAAAARSERAPGLHGFEDEDDDDFGAEAKKEDDIAAGPRRRQSRRGRGRGGGDRKRRRRRPSRESNRQARKSAGGQQKEEEKREGGMHDERGQQPTRRARQAEKQERRREKKRQQRKLQDLVEAEERAAAVARRNHGPANLTPLQLALLRSA